MSWVVRLDWCPSSDDDDLALHLEALNRLDDDEKLTVRALIESILLRHEARRLARTS